jgi:hypothetical protein
MLLRRGNGAVVPDGRIDVWDVDGAGEDRDGALLARHRRRRGIGE